MLASRQSGGGPAIRALCPTRCEGVVCVCVCVSVGVGVGVESEFCEVQFGGV